MMSEYLRSAVDRAMKIQEVIMRAMRGELQWFEAAEIIGVSCRMMRRIKGQQREQRVKQRVNKVIHEK
ncbi:MAG: hypothetical protein R6V03_00090 [Kiritimatiellia bacterium]